VKWTVTHDDGSVTHADVRRDSPCGKAAYRKRKVALAVAKRVTLETGELIQAYRCVRGCHAWHLGHPPGTRGEHTRAHTDHPAPPPPPPTRIPRVEQHGTLVSVDGRPTLWLERPDPIHPGALTAEVVGMLHARSR